MNQNLDKEFNKFVDETIDGDFLYGININYAKLIFDYLRSEESRFKGYEQELVLLLEYLFTNFSHILPPERRSGWIELNGVVAGTGTAEKIDERLIKLPADLNFEQRNFDFWRQKYSHIESTEQTFSKEDVRVYAVRFKFALPELTLAQKLDVLHLFLSGAHYQIRENSEWQYVIKIVNKKRDKLILANLKNEEFSNRIKKAQYKDPEFEKQRADETEQIKKLGRPKGSTKIPKRDLKNKLIDAYNKLEKELDEIPTAEKIGFELKVAAETVRNYLIETGLNDMSTLKVEAEKKRKLN